MAGAHIRFDQLSRGLLGRVVYPFSTLPVGSICDGSTSTGVATLGLDTVAAGTAMS